MLALFAEMLTLYKGAILSKTINIRSKFTNKKRDSKRKRIYSDSDIRFWILFQSALFALWIALKGLLPKAETMILNNYFRPTTSILLTSANNVDGDDGDWQDTSYTQILLLLLV